MEKKYNLSEANQEERDAFMKEFAELLDKHSLYFEPVPQFIRDTIETPWRVVTQIFLQKKTEVVEVDKVVPGAVPSTNPEVNPAIDPMNPQPAA